MSNHEQDKVNLKECLLKAHQLVGEKVEIKEEGSIEETLVNRLEKLEINTNSKEPRKAFVDECLKVLLEIQTALLAVCESGVNEGDKDYLGVRDFRLIHTLLQVIISWGFYPCFLPGVGVPLSKRVKSGYTNHELLSKDEKDQQDHQPQTISTETIYSLLHLVTPLVDVIAHGEKVPSSKSYTTVASILMSRHLPDLYAALLELAYAPTSAFQQQLQTSATETTSSAMLMTPGNMMQQVKKQVGLKREERDKCARMFMWLFDRSDLPRAMESLMALLGNSPLHPVPNWLRTICGRFLSRILLKPNGVAIVLEFTIGHVDQLQLAQLESISKLILSVPQQMASIESYYAIITPQLLELLEKEPLSSPTCQAVTFIIGRIIGKHADLAKVYVVDRIVGPLLTAWNTTEYDTIDHSSNMDRVSLSEDALTTLLHTLHRVMIGGEPSPDVIQTFLSSSIAPLYHLYEFTVHSKSRLRETVLDLLSTYFRITTTSDAIRELKRILLDKVDLSGARVAYFAPGPSGGVVLRLRRSPKLLAGNELPIHAGILVEFLQMSDNADLCGDFFVFLLNEYSSLQSRKQDPKVILLTLHLIMGMLDTLGPTILGKPTQIISFANNIVQDHVERLLKKKEKRKQSNSSHFPDIANIVDQQELQDIQDAAHDEQFSLEDDFESLVLAINLIRAVLHENDELDDQAVQLLKASVEPLKQLEKYPFELVQESVNEVLLAITSYLSAQKMFGMKQTSGTSLEASKEKYRDAMKSLQDDLLPIRAHGMGMLKEMALAKDPLVSSGEGLDQLLDIFVRLVQDEDSYIYLNAVKGLSAMTDAYGNQIIKKLGEIYSDADQKLDNRLRIGEALLQTIQRCGDALGKYVNTLVKPLETVLARRNEDSNLRVSALSLLSMACQTCPVALSSQMSELIDWVLNILEIEKTAEVRRGIYVETYSLLRLSNTQMSAATVLILSLFRGLASQTLYEYPTESLRRTYRTLRYIEETDPDELTRYQARVALSDLDAIMRNEIFKNQHSVNYK